MLPLPRRTAAALAAALLLPGLLAATGDKSQGSAAFTKVAVTGGAGTITVTGASTFGGEPIVVGVDDSGDAILPGTDFGTATITQNAKTGDLVATLELLDGLPTVASVPEGVFFEWNIDVPGGDAIALTAKFNSYTNPAAWTFAVTTYSVDPATGTGNFSSAPTSGEWNGSELVWTVNPAALGASAGDKLSLGSRGPIRTFPGGAGLFTFSIAHYDDMTMDSFVVGGGARVIITDKTGEIVDEGKAKARKGEWTANFKDLKAGTYKVEVITEYGDAAASKSFTVKVA